MAREQRYFGYAHFPAEPPPSGQAVEALHRLENWRAGSAATSVVMAGLLLSAIGFHMGGRVAIACALLAAALLTVWAHLVREIRLTALTIHPRFAHLPELTARRRRLVSPRSRRALAHALRQLASPTRCSSWLDRYTVAPTCTIPPLGDRIADVRPQLIQIAAELEDNHDPDPVCVALLRELLRDGASPVFNPHIPTADLRRTLNRAHAGLTR